jgi:hypothetical protein
MQGKALRCLPGYAVIAMFQEKYGDVEKGFHPVQPGVGPEIAAEVATSLLR